MAGTTKFNNHIATTVLRIWSSGTPAIENNQTATPPRTTTSKIIIVGIIETSKYIVNIRGIASIKGIVAPKKSNRL